jgi:hypothetical protein
VIITANLTGRVLVHATTTAATPNSAAATGTTGH